MTDSPPRRRGAPLGNSNNYRHGLYTRRLKMRPLSGVQPIAAAVLAEELALIRVFTRRLVETFDPDSGVYEHADILRILCLASSSITRLIRAQTLIDVSGSVNDQAGEIPAAIRQDNFESCPHKHLPEPPPPSDDATPLYLPE